ncbi:MAG: hypothetical protein EBQ92_00385 [Proteobacteria bacterium]|nr:hypothetical protein [Pseudomonadota bacterium]
MTKGRNVNALVKLINGDDYKKNIDDMSEDELIKLLRKLSDAYYNSDETLASDNVYDAIREKLNEVNPNNEYLNEVGAPIKGTKKIVKLPYEMGSLQKIKPYTDDVKKWSNKYKGPFILSDKIDGVSAQIYKSKKGEIFLYSRGDGKEGQDISHLIPYLLSKETIKLIPSNVSIRGEIVINKKNFKKISDFMKNARNAVAGLVNSKTVDNRVAKIAELVTYSILHPRYKQSDQMKILKGLGLTVVEYVSYDELSDDILINYLKKRKDKSIYDIDGIVCADDSKTYEHKAGYPEHSIAFKMITDDQFAIATVVDVLWDPSMDGYLVPRVQITPTDLVGTTVTYATAHNAKFIKDNEIGPGAKIKIIRSGDVIPYIMEVVEKVKAKMPTEYEYEWNETEVDIILKNLDGEGGKIVKIKLINNFFNKMGVKFLSKGFVTKLVENGFDTIPKILTAKKNKLNKIEGMGDKVINKIYDEIDRAFDEVDLVTFMSASHKFGRGLGERKLKEILDAYPNILNEKWSKSKIVENVIKVHGFSDKTATLFADNLKSFMNFYDEIAKIKDISRFDDIESSDESGDESGDEEKSLLKGQIIVFTDFRDKNLEKSVAKSMGKVSSAVSGKTTLLVYADNSDKSSSKFQKAESLGIKTMSKSAFVKKYNL